MPTNPNMVAIQTVTVGSGGAASITFSSIPQTYTDLVIKLSTRSLRNDVVDGYKIQFNSDTTAGNYVGRRLYGSGSSVGSDVQSNSAIPFGNSANTTATTFGNAEFYIPNYTGSNYKSISVDGVAENNSATSYSGLAAYIWNSTAAISSITISTESGTNFVQYSTATLYGITSAAVGAKATGGIISQDNDYWYHTFTASGTFTPTQTLTADYLVVAGGGGGGAHAGYDVNYGGGGGAGGMRCTVTATGGGGSLESPVSLVSSTAYTITVGAGGASITNTRGGNNGTNSSIIGGAVSITAQRGGGGGSASGVSGEGDSGGSGGGSGGGASPVTGGAGTANQGYAGGSSAGVSGAPGGGGGGAGGAGANQGGGTIGGSGGPGVATVISGISTTYAGGGAGGGNGTSAQPGGLGGGGAGAITTGNGTAGTANTGGGGGGSGRTTTSASGAGGSGIVILRYAK